MGRWVLWADEARRAKAVRTAPCDWLATRTAAAEMLAALDRADARLRADWGSPRVPWGEVNRFQRLDDAIRPRFSDAAPSLPVPLASARWSSPASLGARRYPGTRRWYGSSGDSFVAAVECARACGP